LEKISGKPEKIVLKGEMDGKSGSDYMASLDLHDIGVAWARPKSNPEIFFQFKMQLIIAPC
jgi:hypothetical protein